MLTIYIQEKNAELQKKIAKLLLGIVLFPLIMLQISCKKLIEIPPPKNLIAEDNVYTNDATAISVLSGIYTSMSMAGGSATGSFTGGFSISELAGLSADELIVFNGVGYPNLLAYYKNDLAANGSNVAGSEHWAILYNYIFKCNAAVEGLTASTSLTSAVKQQLLGEAKFLRAFFYFYLINLYGDVPHALTTDPNVNSLLGRTSKVQIYQQIIADLKSAQEFLNANYLKPDLAGTTTERVRPTKWVASALLARVYLYIDDYVNAEMEATAVINNASFSLPSLNNVFLKNSSEAIWQLQPIRLNFNTEDARLFIIPSTGLSNDNPVYLSDFLLNSFETGDQRRYNRNWIDSVTVSNTTYYFPYKYKINAPNSDINPTTGTQNMTEYLTVFRLGEQYLIRAETRAQQNNITGAQTDLNAIRARAGLPNTTANDKSSLLTAIINERQVELFTEWGHRWFDLKRMGKVDAVMTNVTPLKGGGWQSTDQLYPIPQSDIDKMPNLTQNSGY